MGLQQFDARTGVLMQLPDTDKTGMGRLVKQLPVAVTATATSRLVDRPLFVSPH
jgi:hypothetical protein